MPDKCCVFNCRLDYDSGQRNIMILDSVGLNSQTEKTGNRRGNHGYVESIFNRLTIKQGLKENDID